MSNESPLLYPTIDDPHFNFKIAQHPEFKETEQKPHHYDDLEAYSASICNRRFELMDHQLFVKNFISHHTPYNSLLLYHGLGTGKTCSAIGIAEQMRDYLEQLNINGKIMVVASPNVQGNFRRQLFDPEKLHYDGGRWTMNTCVGNSLLQSAMTHNYTVSQKKQVLQSVESFIDAHYEFMGYTRLSNVIQDQRQKKSLETYFRHRLVIIDEVHNIRTIEDEKSKRIASSLFLLAEKVSPLRFLLLSATPMFNTYREIMWIINLMNMNDGRPKVEERDIFQKDGNFLVDSTTGAEIGKHLLVRKLTGYVSFVRGENPFSFPHRIFPSLHNPQHSFLTGTMQYPQTEFNGTSILKPIQHVDVFPLKIGDFQARVYQNIIASLQQKKTLGNNSPVVETIETTGNEIDQSTPSQGVNDVSNNNTVHGTGSNIGSDSAVPDDSTEEVGERLGYSKVQIPLESLNMVYPSLDTTDNNGAHNVGKDGLETLVEDSQAIPFTFRNKGRSLFEPKQIETYSAKIHKIAKSCIEDDGIHLIFSQYIYGGVVPMALALEEQGFHRYHSSPGNLLSDDYIRQHKIKTRKTQSNTTAKYIMITGSPSFSKHNQKEIDAAVSSLNEKGETVKVVLISKAGSEGIDMRNIRNIHIMEPWYNMSRIEQIVGRGVRNCSHKTLPYKERNCSIYMYASLIPSNPRQKNVDAGASLGPEESIIDFSSENYHEGIDMYLYRNAEMKALAIGRVTRVMKEIAVDCFLSVDANHQSIERLSTKTIQHLANGKRIEIQIGDTPYSAMCDYMESCSYKCSMIDNGSLREFPHDHIQSQSHLEQDTSNKLSTKTWSHLTQSQVNLMMRIKDLFREKHFYSIDDLHMLVSHTHHYPKEELILTLRSIVDEKTVIHDIYERKGSLVILGDLVFFQPREINRTTLHIDERKYPVDVKPSYIQLQIDEPERVQLTSPTKSSALEPTIARTNLEEPNRTEYINGDNQDIQNIQNIKNLQHIEPNHESQSQHQSHTQSHTQIQNETSIIQLLHDRIEEIKQDRHYNIILPVLRKLISFDIQDALIEYVIERMTFYERKRLLAHVLRERHAITSDEQPVEGTADGVSSLLKQCEAYFVKNSIVLDAHGSSNNDDRIYFIHKNSYVEYVRYDDASQSLDSILDFERKELEPTIKELLTTLYQKKGFHEFIGICVYQQSRITRRIELTFKLKERENKRSTGRICNGIYKSHINEIVASLTDEHSIIQEVTDMQNIHSCFFIELLMRSFNNMRPDKVWHIPTSHQILIHERSKLFPDLRI